MSDPFGRWIPGLDPLTGSLTLPLWAVGALAALLVVLLALALSRAGRDGVAGGLSRTALILIGAALALFFTEGTVRQDVAAERRALAARADQLAARVNAPGSPLACLDALAGDTVEGSCERTLFATPEAMASAVSYVAAQLRLFADISGFVQRGHTEMEPVLEGLRRAIESDRYGLVAHVLATRDGCTIEQCPAAALLRDAKRVNTNLAQRTYDFYVTRHSSVWPAPAPGPSARAAPGAIPGVVPGLPPAASAFASPRPAGPEVFFPSASSIPPVNIMTAEPAGEPETTGAATPRPAPRRTPTPPVPQFRPAEPMDLNAAARGAPPVSAQ